MYNAKLFIIKCPLHLIIFAPSKDFPKNYLHFVCNKFYYFQTDINRRKLNIAQLPFARNHPPLKNHSHPIDPEKPLPAPPYTQTNPRHIKTRPQTPTHLHTRAHTLRNLDPSHLGTPGLFRSSWQPEKSSASCIEEEEADNAERERDRGETRGTVSKERKRNGNGAQDRARARVSARSARRERERDRDGHTRRCSCVG